MKKKYLSLLVLILSFQLTGCASPEVKALRNNEANTSDASGDQTPEQSNRIFISRGEVQPKIILVSTGDTVYFSNLDGNPHRIASDPHPEHSLLPELYSNVIYKDEVYEFIFSIPGTWGYHLEDNPSIRGEIVVE